MENRKTIRMTREEKLARAVKLRDAAIAIVRRCGTWEPDGSGTLKIMGARTDGIQILSFPKIRSACVVMMQARQNWRGDDQSHLAPRKLVSRRARHKTKRAGQPQ